MSTATLNTPPQGAPMPPVLTEQDVIEKFKGYALERFNALNAYPDAQGNREKLEIIREILDALNQAAKCYNPREAMQLVLRQALNFHFIAPRQTRRLFFAWYMKIENLFGACRTYLGRQRQY